MAKKKIRRSEEAHRRKMFVIWIAVLFFVVLILPLYALYINGKQNPPNRALTEPVDYSKIHFEGLALGDGITDDIAKDRIIDAEFDYYWHNISIAVDSENKINRLAFYATDETSFDDVFIDYRGYPVTTISDFIMYFGYTRAVNFRNYKYVSYVSDDYLLSVNLLDKDIYNIDLRYRKADEQ